MTVLNTSQRSKQLSYLESKERVALIDICATNPITRNYIYGNFNEGIRTPAQSGRAYREGLRSGIPDITLAYPAKDYHGLYIELKAKIDPITMPRRKKPMPTETQLHWIAKLNKVGYLAVVCWGWEEAWTVICDYLDLKHTSIT